MDNQNQVPSVGDYIVVQLLGMIPIAGFILMIIWAVGGLNIPIWKRNYARAYFVMLAVIISISVTLSAMFLGLLGSVFSGIF